MGDGKTGKVRGLPNRSPGPVRRATPSNLPQERSTFVGREREIDRLRSLLAERRMVTLVGVGGSGKTRLALRTATREVERFRGGVFFVDLAPVADPGRLAAAFASAVGLTTGGARANRAVEDVLVDFLASIPVLLLVDNCEHLLDPVAGLVDRLLTGCPALVLCATSREPLGLEGEHVFRVPPLSLPQERTDAREAESVRLFLDRAGEVREGFSPDVAELGAIAELCRRLDGIPLAIEFAAARVAHLSPRQIGDRLADALHLLSGGRRRIERHQTLEAALDWSHELLTDGEQKVFRRLGVFPGSFDVGAAEGVASGPDVPRKDVLDLLASLVAKSLVTTQESPDGLRYQLLETLRAYAVGKLQAAGELEDRRSRHRDHYLSWLEEDPSDRNLWSSKRVRLCMIELDNLRAAAARSIEEDRPDLLGRMAARAAAGLGDADPLVEVRDWLRHALAEPDRLSDEERLACYAAASLVSLIAADGKQAELADEAIELAGDRPGVWLVAALNARATARREVDGSDAAAGIDPGALEDFRRAIRIARAARIPYWTATSLTFLASEEGFDSEEALAHLLEARDVVSTEEGYEGVEAWVLSRLALALFSHGRTGEALEVALRAVEVQAASGSAQFRNHVAAHASAILAAGGRIAEARDLLQPLLASGARTRLPFSPSLLLDAAGMIALAAGQTEAAARLIAAARDGSDSSERRLGRRRSQSVALRALVREALGPEAFERGEAEAVPMSLGEAMRYANDTLESLDEPSAAESTPADTEESQAAIAASAFRKEGDYWSITWAGSTFRLRDLRGLHYIRHLLENPGRELHAVDLVRLGREACERDVAFTLGDAGTPLDARAKQAYRERLEVLRFELDEARSFGDLGRIGALEAERESIARELAAAVGLGGRDRKAASASERARVNATRTIRDAVKKIREHAPDLAHILSNTIRTGTYCAYEPE